MAQHIPAEILRRVFHFLAPKDRTNVMSVNTEWRAAASHNELWDDNTIILTTTVSRLPTYARNLTVQRDGVSAFTTLLSHDITLPAPDLHTLTATDEFVPLQSLSFLTKVPNLRSLDVLLGKQQSPRGAVGASQATDLELDVELEVCKIAALTSLTKLKLEVEQSGPGALAPLSCLDKLEDLSLRLDNLKNTNIDFLAALTSLKRLALSGDRVFCQAGLCMWVKMTGLTVLTALTALEGLDLSRCGTLGPEMGPVLAQLTNLRSLNTSRTGLELQGLKGLCDLTLLTSLKLGYTVTASKDTDTSAGVACLTKLTNLKVLHLGPMVLNRHDVQLLSSFQQLEDLRLDESSLFTTSAHVIGQLTNLRHLDISHIEVPGEGLSYVNNLSKLQVLTARALDLMGNTLDLSHLKNLRRLDLGYTFMGPSGAAALSPLSTLTHLILCNAWLVAADVQHLSTLTKLQALDLSSNTIGPQAVTHLSTLVSLTSLSLSGCSLSDDQGSDAAVHLSALSALTKLEDLRLTANQLPPAAVQQLSCLVCLKTLDLGRNNLGGNGHVVQRGAPGDLRALSSLTQLTSLSISSNNLHHTAGSQLACVTSLVVLQASDNMLDTSALSAMTTLTKMTCLVLTGNLLDSTVVDVLPKFQQLRWVDLGKNDIQDGGVVVEKLHGQHSRLKVHL